MKSLAALYIKSVLGGEVGEAAWARTVTWFEREFSFKLAAETIMTSKGMVIFS